MGLFSNKEFGNLEDLLVEQIQDLYDAELQMVDALPKMVDGAESPELKAAFSEHLTETKNHVRRLEQAFQMLGQDPKRESCQAMKGLLKEGEHMLDANGSGSVKDAALIAAAQRIEHYEIAGYGTARSFARKIGREDLANVLQQSLDEEGRADKKLTEVAESGVNLQAVRG